MAEEKNVADNLATEKEGEADLHEAPGTTVLVIVFLFSFAVYFFANWLALADVWEVR
ncbi:MAG: hypothetical protein OEY14_07995 [Myxococcales bacterium]|nr:hypothetical protein [Myxococcales bacterium]